MSRLFIPAIALLNRLKYASKFYLIGFVFLLPIAVMLVYLFGEMNKNIDFSKKERLGIAYYQPLKTFLNGVQKHRGLSYTYLNGEASYEERMTREQQNIDLAIQAVNEADLKYGTELETTEKWKALQGKWQSLQKEAFTLQAKKSFAIHTALVDDTLSFISHIADSSNLILDPELDSYYLMDGIVMKLPSVSEKIGQTRAIGTGVTARKAFQDGEREQLIALLVHINSTYDAAISGLDVAIKENPAIGDQLKASREKNDAAINSFMEKLQKIISSERPDTRPDEYFDAATKAIEANFGLYDQEAAVLDGLLQTRIDEYTAKKRFAASLVAAVIVALLYLFFAFYLSVIRTVKALERSANRLAEGDLTARVALDTKDELALVGNSFNAMAESFGSMVASSKRLAQQVAGSARDLSVIADQSAEVTAEIASGNQQIAGGAENQAQGAEETAKAMEEMAVGIQRIAETSGTVSDLSSQMTGHAEYGSEIIRRTVEQMHVLQTSTGKVAQTIQQMEEQAEKIGHFADVISGISMQTNLLALNASIESARAGEHGRGFAVVAQEIRKLAEQTKASTINIAVMIEEVQHFAGDAVRAIQEGMGEMDKGIGLIHDTGDAFDRILHSVRDVSRQIDEVSAASEQMSAGSEQVTASVEEMATIAKEAASISQNVASASEEQMSAVENLSSAARTLDGMAQELNGLVRKFNV